jgi:uncharacterized membrane protein YqjE
MRAAGSSSPPTGSRRAGVLGRAALHEVQSLAADYASLAVLDARNAAMRLAWVLSAGLIAAVLIVTAWLALVAGGVVWILGSGATWSTALTVAAGVNVLGAVAMGVWMRVGMKEPPFAATLRHLKGASRAVHGETS